MQIKEMRPLFEIENVFELKSISSFFVFSFEKGYRCPEEAHRSYELVFNIEGKETVVENGVGFPLLENQIFIHDSMAPHYDQTESDKAVVCVMTFEAKSPYLKDIVGRSISLTSEQATALKEIFNYGFSEIHQQSPWMHSDDKRIRGGLVERIGSTQVLKNRIENFFISLFNSVHYEKKKNQGFDDQVLSKVINALEEEKMHSFSLQTIADKTNYSKSYLCRYFKSKMGTTIAVFFYQLKVNEAKKLLLDPKLSTKDVCTMVGFESPQYFSTVFKKYTGSSPAAWRSAYQL